METRGYRLERWLAVLLSLLFFLPFVARGDELGPFTPVKVGQRGPTVHTRAQASSESGCQLSEADMGNAASTTDRLSSALRRAHSALSRLLKLDCGSNDIEMHTKLLLLFGVLLLLG